jgi:hypothetical protein
MSLSERDLLEMEKRVVLLEAGLTAHARVDLLALVAEVKRLRDALEHYADEEMWTAPPGHTWDDLDKGYYVGEGPGYGVARAALGGGTDRRTGGQEPPDSSGGLHLR